MGTTGTSLDTQMTSMMAQTDGNDETDGTSGFATWTHTDEMAHR